MINSFAALAAVIAAAASGGDRCAEPKSEREEQICSHLEKIENLEIRSVESVAVGSHEQMLDIRPRARGCRLLNRIDYVGENVSVFDIINADQESRRCLVDWIRANKPELLFTSERLERLVTIQ